MNPSTSPQEFTILYTANLRGRLERLPRLFTFLQRLKQEHDPGTLLLDLGYACAPDVWHCAATEGRSTLVVLDAMGYHAVNTGDFLNEAQRSRIQQQLTTGLVDAQHVWRYRVPPLDDPEILVANQPNPALKLCIIAAPAAETTLEQGLLHLQTVDEATVGLVRVDLQAMRCIQQERLSLPKQIRPDATIAATVEFVTDEAKFYQKRQR